MNDMTRFEQRLDNWLTASAPSRAPRQILTGLAERVAEAPQERVLWGPFGRPVAGHDIHPNRRRFGTFAAGSAAVFVLGLLAVVAVWRLPALIGPGATPTPPSTPRPTAVAHLVYAMNGGLYVANADGTETRFIAGDDPSDPCGGARLAGEGFVSPDGQYLAYRTAQGQGCLPTITISDLKGNEVVTFPGDGWDIGWSADSTRVVTWLEFGKEIAVYGLDGVRQQVLDGSLMCCGDYDPIWSPDGAESILVWARGTVWELPLDGSEPRALPANDARSNAGNGGPGVWYSPDRTRAVFVARATGDLMIANADGGDGRVLTAATLGSHFDAIVWSPSGQRIAFALVKEPRFVGEEPESSVLSVVEVATGQLATVKARAGGSARPLSFSADGQSVLFGSHGLWAANLDGTGERLVLEGADYGSWITTK
jgi:Tol biopolymer transport system component